MFWRCKVIVIQRTLLCHRRQCSLEPCPSSPRISHTSVSPLHFFFARLVCFSILISCLSAGTRAKALCFRVYLYLTSRSATSARSLAGRERVSTVVNRLAGGKRRAAPLNWDFWTNLCSVFELQSNKWTVEGVCNGD